MEVVVGVAIGTLTAVILVIGVGLCCLVHRKCCKKNKDPLTVEHAAYNNFDRKLIDEEAGDEPITLENVLQDEVWIDDVTGVMDHCLPILKGCHELTSRLVPIIAKECHTDSENAQVEEMAKKVTPRIEDVVQLLDGPLDPRLVEARCTALFYSVTNLTLVIKPLTKDDGFIEWLDISLNDIEDHLKVLQEQSQKLCSRPLLSSVGERGGSSSPESEVSPVSHMKSGSRASSSHTDSAESGIDINMSSDQFGSDSEAGKSLSPNHIQINSTDSDVIDNGPTKKHFAVAEVHREMEVEQVELHDFGIDNKAYDLEANS